MLPAFFVAHGSPMMAIEDKPYTRFLRSLGAGLPRPKAIVLFSAHWESDVQQVSAVDEYRTIYDFRGFPPELYQVTYPARGDRTVSEEIGRLFAQEGIPYANDTSRGLDHGAWCVLRMLYPEADVPVVAMSVNPDLSPAEQFRIGKALSALRANDILLIFSGVTVHNFSTIRWRAPENEADAWAVAFDDWVLRRASEWDLTALFSYDTEAPHARMAVPPNGREHFVPLFYALGAADDQRSVKELYRGYEMGNLSYVVWQFGG